LVDGPHGWFSSRRDSMIVARHEVPGVTRKIAPPQRAVELDLGLD
jgi:hypothetical protein